MLFDLAVITQGKKKQYFIKCSKSYLTGACKLHLERTCQRQTLPDCSAIWFVEKIVKNPLPLEREAEIYLNLTKIHPKTKN